MTSSHTPPQTVLCVCVRVGAVIIPYVCEFDCFCGGVFGYMCVYTCCVYACLCGLAVYSVARPYGALSRDRTTHLALLLALVFFPSVTPLSFSLSSLPPSCALSFSPLSFVLLFFYFLELGFFFHSVCRAFSLSLLCALSCLKQNPKIDFHRFLSNYKYVCLYVSVNVST